jgi:integrase
MRRVKDARIKTAEARQRLGAGRVHWEDMGHGLHLGWRRGATAKAGQWLARYYLGSQKYRQEVIGNADDAGHTADGRDVVDYFQARDRAHEKIRERRNEAAGLPAKGGDLTVGGAILHYCDWLEGRGGGADVRSRAMAKIAPSLGHIKVRQLKQVEIEAWLAGLAATPVRLRQKHNAGPRYADDPEVQRRRRATANRLLIILKASLNRCWRLGLVQTSEAWARVAPFRGTVASRVRYLLPAEGMRLIRAAAAQSPAFARLVQLGLCSGCRYAELTALKVEDFDGDAGTLHIRQSKSGKSRFIVLGGEGRELLRGLTAGRRHDELILVRDNGGPWIRNSQNRPMRAACLKAGIKPLPFHCLRHTWASNAAMNGLSLPLIARNLGHSSIAMAERHYAHLAQDYAAREIVSRSPVFGFDAGKVMPIDSRRRRT